MTFSPTIDRAAASGSPSALDLPAEIFDVQTNVPLLHQVVVAQLAAARQGTHKTKTRAEVSGAGRKPFAQKGTGRARQGSIRAPHMTGGGVVHGPTPRDYSQRTPKKMKAAALRGALSDRARNGRIHVVTELVEGTTPSTKNARLSLLKLPQFGNKAADKVRYLVVLEQRDTIEWLSLRNLTNIHLISVDQLNTYDVLVSDAVVFTEESFEKLLQLKLPANRGAGNLVPNLKKSRDSECIDTDYDLVASNNILHDAHKKAEAMHGVISRISKDSEIDGWSIQSDEIEYVALERHETYVLATWPSTFDAADMINYLKPMSDKITALFIRGADSYASEGVPIDWTKIVNIGEISFVRAELGNQIFIWKTPDEQDDYDNRFFVVDTEIDEDRLFPLIRETTKRTVTELLAEVLGDSKLNLCSRQVNT